MKNILKIRMEFMLLVLISIDGIYSGCCCKRNKGNNGNGKSNSKGKPGEKPENPTNKKIKIKIKEKNKVGEGLEISIDQNAIVADLKFEIFKVHHQFLSKKQKLFYNNILLENDFKTLVEYNINNGSVIELEMENTGTNINITLTTPSNKSQSVAVNPSETIGEIKLKASEMLKLLINRLIFYGKELYDNYSTLSDYNVKEGSVIHVILNTVNMRIKLKINKNKILNVNITDKTGINKLKEHSSKELGVEENKIILSYRNVELENDKTTSDYNIQDGEEVVCTIKN